MFSTDALEPGLGQNPDGIRPTCGRRQNTIWTNSRGGRASGGSFAYCHVQRRGVFLFAFRGGCWASSAGCANHLRSLCCRSSLAMSGCLCPLAPDWRTAIACPVTAPNQSLSVQPPLPRRFAAVTFTLVLRQGPVSRCRLDLPMRRKVGPFFRKAV